MSLRVLDEWVLTPFRLAIHQPTSTAVVADVHLGYREARRQCGEAIPLLGMRQQLAPLGRARKKYQFKQMLVAGDLFERGVRADLLDEFRAELQRLNITFLGLVPGNHDRASNVNHPNLPLYPAGMVLGTWRIVHGDAALSDQPLVLGHWHPVVHHEGRRVPCYLAGPGRLVLPAFSADAAGGPVANQQQWRGLRRYGIVGNVVAVCHPDVAPTAQRKTRGRASAGFIAKQVMRHR